MSDIEKGKIDAVPPTNPTPPKPELTEKEKMKESHFWRKTAIYAGLAAFVVLVIFFSSCKFLPTVISRHCAR